MATANLPYWWSDHLLVGSLVFLSWLFGGDRVVCMATRILYAYTFVHKQPGHIIRAMLQ